MRVKIELVGYDDSTEFNMKMTSEQYEFLNKIADESRAHSTYQCMPIMNIEILEDED